MSFWFPALSLLSRIALALLALPLFLLFMGTVAFLGMGNGSSGFDGKYTIQNIVSHLCATMFVGLMTTVGIVVFYELIQLGVRAFSVLQTRLGLN